MKNFFIKLLSFFKYKKKTPLLPELEENISSLNADSSNIFKENISEYSRLLDLQKKYEQGNISGYSLSIKQMKELISLYEKQILELDIKLDI